MAKLDSRPVTPEIKSNQEVYAVTAGPMAEKMDIRRTLVMASPGIGLQEIWKAKRIAENFPQLLIERLNGIIGIDESPILVENQPIGERRKRATQEVNNLLINEGGKVIALEPTHLNWNEIDKERVKTLQVNRIWDIMGRLIGIGSRPIPNEKGYDNLRNQLEEIFRDFNGDINSLTIVEDIIDSGASLLKLINIIRELGGDVRIIILTGGIYPKRKKKLEDGDFKGIEIVSGNAIADSGAVVKGGFNIVDCAIGGLGNTYGRYSKMDNEPVPLVVGKRSDGNPMPGSFLYGSLITWGNFLKITPKEKQPSVILAILKENYKLWEKIQAETGITVKIADLQRFPLGLGIKPDEINFDTNILDFINILINRNTIISETELDVRLEKVENVVLDVDGTLTDNNGEIQPKLVDLITRLKEGGVKIYIDSLRSYGTFKKVDEKVNDWFIKNANGAFFEFGSVSVNNEGTPTALVQNRDYIVNTSLKIEKVIAEKKVDGISKSPYPTVGADYFFVTTEDPEKNLERCQELTDILRDEIDLPPGVDIKPTEEGSLIVTDTSCDKAFPLRLLGLEPESTLAIGDGRSDRTMFNFSNNGGIAVDISPEKMREGANYRTSKNNIDGTIEILQKLVFAKNL